MAFLAALALAGAAGPTRSAAIDPCTDLLGIGHFDQGTTGWTTTVMGGGVDLYLVAAPDDRLGNPNSSAALVYNQSTVAGAAYPIPPVLNVAGGCLPVATGQSVRVGGWIRIPTGQATSGSALIAAAGFDGGASCGNLLGFAETTSVSTPGDWTAVDDTFVVPPGVTAVSVGLSSLKNEATGTFASYFDDLYVCVPEPSAAALACAAGATLAALARRARHRLEVSRSQVR